MKKFQLLFVLFFTCSFLWTQEVAIPPDMPAADPPDGEALSEASGDGEDGEQAPEKKKFRMKNRMVEVSLANVSINAANSFISAADMFRDTPYILSHMQDIIQKPTLMWQDPVVIDIDDFLSGFTFNFDTCIQPFSFNFNWRDKWGVGLDIARVEAAGNMSLSGKMLTFQEGSDTFGAGAAVFVDMGIPVFFHINKLKIKLRPAMYVPMFYSESSLKYSRRLVVDSQTGQDKGDRYELSYDMRIYSLLDMDMAQSGGIDGVANDWGKNGADILGNSAGYDFNLCVEYPLIEVLDVGVNMVNIPLANATLYHYMQFQGEVFLDMSEVTFDNLSSLEDGKGTIYDYPDDKDFKPKYGYNSNGKKIYRPFKMLFYGNYRPFNTQFFSLIPLLGFSYSSLYMPPDRTHVEGGLSARFDLANIFIATLGINYTDHRWKNGVDFILNLRAFELDLGLSSQSQDFEKSFRGAGLGVNFGLKFGW